MSKVSPKGHPVHVPTLCTITQKNKYFLHGWSVWASFVETQCVDRSEMYGGGSNTGKKHENGDDDSVKNLPGIPTQVKTIRRVRSN